MIDSPIQQIKDRLDVVQVLEGYIKLQRAGQNYRALCPIHSEKKPSFFVSPVRQSWHCFGCSSGGSIFDFVMKIEGVEFADALRILARKAGVELKKDDPKIRSERQRIYELLELSCCFFEKQLQESKKGSEAKDYLLNRKINKQSIEKWRLGYAPDIWQGLSDFLVSRGYQREEADKAGLSVKGKDGKLYDRFRSRIMFPIFDLNAQVIGFTGRIFGSSEEETAKYLNTPNTLLYDKSRILYGLDRARMAIRKKDQCVLVEGQTDVIMSHQAGVENVIATSGTALTTYQLSLLKRYSDKLVSAFDMDVAGDSATKRGIDLAQAQGFDIKVAVMPREEDPADIVARDPESWEKLISQAKTILDFYFETTLSRIDSSSPEGKKEIAKNLLPPIKRIPNKIEQSYWIQKLADELGVREEVIEEELRKTKMKEDLFGLEKEEVSEQALKPRREVLEEAVLSLLLNNVKLLDLIDDLSLFSLDGQTIINSLKKDPKFNFEKELPELNNFINYLLLRAEIEEGVDLEQEFRNCLKEIQVLDTKNKLDRISQEIRQAEREKDIEKTSELSRQFNHLTKKLF